MKGNNRDFAINSVVVEFEGPGDRADGLSNPIRIDTWSCRFDDPGRLVTVLGWRDRRLEVLAIAEHDLGPIESDSFDAQTDFPGARLRKRKVIKLEDLGGPGLMEANDLYGVGHAYLAATEFSMRRSCFSHVP
jgi:hypothetical protein